MLYAMEPISAVSDAFTALFSLIGKSLPSDTERLERLKLNYPRIYFRIKQHILKQAARYVMHHKGIDLNAYVDLIATNPQDKVDLLAILKSEVIK